MTVERFFNENGRPPTEVEYRKMSNDDNWEEALRQNGLNPAEAHRDVMWEIAREKARFPKTRDVEESDSLPSLQRLYNFHDVESFYDLLKIAGFPQIDVLALQQLYVRGPQLEEEISSLPKSGHYKKVRPGGRGMPAVVWLTNLDETKSAFHYLFRQHPESATVPMSEIPDWVVEEYKHAQETVFDEDLIEEILQSEDVGSEVKFTILARVHGWEREEALTEYGRPRCAFLMYLNDAIGNPVFDTSSNSVSSSEMTRFLEHNVLESLY